MKKTIEPAQQQSPAAHHTEAEISRHLDEAEDKAWQALARYKPMMFGYWCAIWVHLNRISGQNRPNPWRELVHAARDHLARKESKVAGVENRVS